MLFLSRMHALPPQVLYAASEMSESRPRGRREPTILPEQYEVLKHQLEAMQEEVKLYEDEVPRAFFPTKIDTPFLGTIEDTHQVRPSHPNQPGR